MNAFYIRMYARFSVPKESHESTLNYHIVIAKLGPRGSFHSLLILLEQILYVGPEVEVASMNVGLLRFSEDAKEFQTREPQLILATPAV
jgi:hypothetical protein